MDLFCGLFSKLWALHKEYLTTPNMYGYQNGNLILGTTHMWFVKSSQMVFTSQRLECLNLHFREQHGSFLPGLRVRIPVRVQAKVPAALQRFNVRLPKAPCVNQSFSIQCLPLIGNTLVLILAVPCLYTRPTQKSPKEPDMISINFKGLHGGPSPANTSLARTPLLRCS